MTGGAHSPLVDHLIDLLHPWGLVGARHMFGGWGLYRGRVMFGLVADETLFLKTDETNLPDYKARGMAPFRYERAGKTIALSYCTVPADVIESGDELAGWAEKAYQAALREASRDRRDRPRPR
jgi:DNA transformation protein and related proteins